MTKSGTRRKNSTKILQCFGTVSSWWRRGECVIKAAEWWHQEHPSGSTSLLISTATCLTTYPCKLRTKWNVHLSVQIHNRFMEEYRKCWDFLVEEGSSYEEFVEEAGKMLSGAQLSIIETTEHTDFLKT